MRIFLFLPLLLGFSVPVLSEEVTYRLANGDIISGELLKEESNGKVKVIKNPYLGKITIQTSSIAPNEDNSNSKDWNWNNSIEITYESLGVEKKDEKDLSFNFTSNYEDPLNKFQLETAYSTDYSSYKDSLYKSEKESFSLDITNHRDLGKKFTLYSGINYQHEYFSDLSDNSIQHDLLSSLGIGYKLLDNKNSSLLFTLAPSLHFNSDCSDCGNLLYASTVKGELDWTINELFILDLSDTYSIANGESNIENNKFDVGLKYYPNKVGSSFYTSMNYSTYYHEITDSTPTYDLKLGLGLNL